VQEKNEKKPKTQLKSRESEDRSQQSSAGSRKKT